MLRPKPYLHFTFVFLSVGLFVYFLVLCGKNLFRYNYYQNKQQDLLNKVMLAYTKHNELRKMLIYLDDLSYLEYEIKLKLSYSYDDEQVYIFN